MTRISRQAALLTTLAATVSTTLAGCSVGPDYRRPVALLPPQYKELVPAPGWVRADPAAATAPKGEWWRIYNDPVLDALEAQVDLNNQNLARYQAQYRAAAAAIDAARASFFPTLSATAADTRQYTGRGSNVTTNTATGGGVNISGSRYSTSYQLEPQAKWTLDIWGQIRRQVESQGAAAQAAAADVANARLSYQATLAEDYFELRAADANYDLLTRSAVAYEQSAKIIGNQYRAGTTAPSDYLQAETQAANARASAIQVQAARAQYEHAIAVLTGQPPAALTLAHGTLTNTIPAVPVALPSTLLQRRPDIASAERTVQQENALIGAQEAAFYPQVDLSALIGFAGDPLHSIFNAAHLLWTLGATASQTIWSGGARSAAVEQARANYEAAVATYRETVLEALQGVEDNLSNLRIYAAQAVAAQQAVDLANQALTIANNEYFAGTQAYTTVLTAQTTALSDAQSVISVQLNRLNSSVALIQNLGGGWDASAIPARAAMEQNPLLPWDRALPKP
ncbi:NodT family efflux transporter outer membrane factor (OMF) lipoprotein [Endobacter medicaginis]|uniref:Efflux transporter outer membrane subunit n=1 Tax=Endobacter medicaginis TaxID=1181271 RepID=A0A839UU75_9PROT|nr:efflux transporter outer membrane subunit [Endobacter medicaginis]MBB3173326.1 NodT family efflux transporter outer membrane factor (OMF) lipoprotein [Endobacter medicaginis]MCX5475713.1 efflux transporter outer membrane subunit [Endobacter medicaginis]NVN28823.1 efflux transporter outer membrane subunit [Endobacter medicaginis]